MLLAQLAEELAAVLGADMDVEERDLDGLARDGAARVAERAGLEDAVSLELEVDAAQEANRRLVVDDENGGRLPLHAAEVYPRPG